MINFYENVFDSRQIHLIHQQLQKPEWKFWHASNSESNNFFWHMNLIQYSFFTKDLFSSVKKCIGKNYTLERVYANGQTFGLDGHFHIDSENPNSYTFLYYPMSRWDLQWGGETVVLNPNGTVNYINPKPNSSVFFPANWTHYGKSPSKSYPDLRVTVAYKLLKSENDQH